MTNFIRYKDEIINLDLVANISKEQFHNHDIFEEDKKITYAIIFWGAYLYSDGNTSRICYLKFDNEEIRDKTFDDICYTIANNLNCSLDSITEIGTIKT